MDCGRLVREHLYNDGRGLSVTTYNLIEGLFRNTAKGREPLATPNSGGSHVHYSRRERVGIGCITSRPANCCQPATFYEQLAVRLGVHIDVAKRLHLENKVT